MNGLRALLADFLFWLRRARCHHEALLTTGKPVHVRDVLFYEYAGCCPECGEPTAVVLRRVGG